MTTVHNQIYKLKGEFEKKVDLAERNFDLLYKKLSEKEDHSLKYSLLATKELLWEAIQLQSNIGDLKGDLPRTEEI